MSRVIGFGDLLVHLSPPGYQRLMQADHFDVNYTGAEANTLVSLALFGVDTQFVTRLPDNLVTDCALNNLRRYRVGVDHVVLGGDRIGVYYLEKGASQRPSRLVYDRKFTSLATTQPGDLDWERIFEGATHFHFTGITPALGPQLPAICQEACQAAHRHGMLVSCDLNYRSALWNLDTARRVMGELAPEVDILIGNEEDPEKLLGVKPQNTDVSRGQLDKAAYEEVAAVLTGRYSFKAVAFTLRQSLSASDNIWSGMLYQDGQVFRSREYAIHLVDRVGGGDAFSAGLLYGMIQGYDPQHTVDFAAAASCLKQTMEQDFGLSYPEEVEALLRDGGAGRIQP